MKGLIIRKEWLDLILSGHKKWEMRSKPTSIRGQIALIEAGSGEIKGVAELVDSLPAIYDHEPDGYDYSETYHQIHDHNLLKKWPYPWVLDEVFKLDFPIKYKHPQGAVIWVNLPDNIINI